LPVLLMQHRKNEGTFCFDEAILLFINN